MEDILKSSRSRGDEGGGHRNGSYVSGSKVAALACALQLPGFEWGAKVAREIRVTRASVSIWTAEFGRRLGVTSEASAKMQVGGIMAMARVKAGLKPRLGPVARLYAANDHEKLEVREWLASLPEEERETAKRALKGRVE